MAAMNEKTNCVPSKGILTPAPDLTGVCGYSKPSSVNLFSPPSCMSGVASGDACFVTATAAANCLQPQVGDIAMDVSTSDIPIAVPAVPEHSANVVIAASESVLDDTSHDFDAPVCPLNRASTSSVNRTDGEVDDANVTKEIADKLPLTQPHLSNHLRQKTIENTVSTVSKRFKRKQHRREVHREQLHGKRDWPVDADDDEPRLKRSREEDDVGFGQSVFNETEYYFENGLRKVYPYYFTYLTHCKGRWIGRKLADVFSVEFRNSTPESNAKSIASGRLRVNGHMVSPDYVFQGTNELVSNLVHRHEVPVNGAPIKVLAVTDDLVVIDKPSSLPVHPCGRYRHNSVAFVLGKDHGLHNLRTLYRLDRLTSGILLMARTHATADRMMQHIKDHDVTKVYVCRVDGEFPSRVECEEPMDRVHHTLGTWRVKKGGKPCHTTFERLNYNGRTSVVKCIPRTGRTHQIRVHLQYLGFPITNDPLYNHDVWGPSKGKGGDYGKSDEQLYNDLLAVHTVENYTKLELAVNSPPRDPASTFDPALLMFDSDCEQCGIKYKDPRPDELVMCLHALSYKGPNWEYSTELPDWAKDKGDCKDDSCKESSPTTKQLPLHRDGLVMMQPAHECVEDDVPFQQQQLP